MYARLAFGLSEADAYELQRVLQSIRGFERGRPGPGGGAPATAFSLTAFTIAVMAGGARRRAVETVFRYHELVQEGAELAGWGDDFKPTILVCPFTGQRQFGPALTHIFETAALAERVEKITITRDWPEAVIKYRDGDAIKASQFVAEHHAQRVRTARLPGALVTRCTLGGAIVHQTAIDLGDHEDAEWTSDVGSTK